MAKKVEKKKWSVERRLEFIDFRLYWDGRVNRSDLVEFFGISVPQASADLASYLEAAKGNAEYDKTAKAYVIGRKYKPRFFEPSASGYLAQLRLMAAGLLDKDEIWTGRIPPFSVVPLLNRRLDPAILRILLDAVHTRSMLNVTYQSFSRPAPQQRVIVPHAFGFDGFRWHVRAWCHKRGSFCDFVIARLLSAEVAEKSNIDPAGDVAWSREVTLRLGPHPEMPDGQRRAVELDFGMSNGVVEISTKACLAYYLIRQMGLDDGAPPGMSSRLQLVLLNRDEVTAAADAARAASNSTGAANRDE